MIRNPDAYCIKCGHLWGLTEESCPEYGFDPVNDADNADENDIARDLYKESRDESE